MKSYLLSIPANADLSPAVRNIAEKVFALTALKSRTQDRLKLVFAELYMNAVKYGSKESDPIYIHFYLLEDKIQVIVEDQGTGKNQIKAAELKKIIDFQEQNNDPTKTSGRGLAQITKKWTDFYDIADSKKGGIAVIFEKFFTEEEEKPKISSQKQELEKKNSTESAKKEPNTPEKPQNLPTKTFKFVGEIDGSHIAEDSKEIEAFLATMDQPHLLVLDFGELKFFVSTFIGKIASWHQQAIAKRGDLKIIKVQKDAYDILDLVGLTKIITIELSDS
jgi:anti-anti-sigma factor